MLKRSWKKIALAAGCGVLLLQAPTCAETTANLADMASIITSIGVMYLVTRVME